MSTLLTSAAFAATLAIVVLRPQAASAHCDTLDGPTARDGLKALATGNLNHALKWVTTHDEAELSSVFERSLAARALGGVAREVADRWFLENLVRLHRSGEGAGFTGLGPSGSPIDEKVAAADRSIAERSLEPLAGLVPSDRVPELNRRLAIVLARQDFDVDDIPAGRAYVAAYVNFFKFAEGEDHEHAHTPAGHP
ncbi:MAG TPA: DUF6448 family protein [Nocardioides sp.]|nr:DUF6448 family protein [Nocardioides sp.]